MRVLVIDDTRDANYVLRKMLETAGCEVETASDARAGLAAAAEFLPDVVCLDIGLPDLNGHELARRLRAIPSLRETRIIAISGYPPEEDQCRQAGFDAYLVKPAGFAERLSLLEQEAGEGGR